MVRSKNVKSEKLVDISMAGGNRLSALHGSTDLLTGLPVLSELSICLKKTVDDSLS